MTNEERQLIDKLLKAFNLEEEKLEERLNKVSFIDALAVIDKEVKDKDALHF